MERILFALALAFSLVAGHAQAKPLSREQVPEPLKPWVDWVLLDNPEYRCPFLYNSFDEKRCGWPTRLDLNLDGTQGRFEVAWDLFLDSTLVLPGDEKNWPGAVTVNGEPAVVGERNGRPVLSLASGEYQISGVFRWDRIPESLTIPADSGLIALKIKGNQVAFPKLNGDRLWLSESDSGRKARPDVGNTLDIQVFRRVIDEIPLQVVTRLDIKVAGDQREVLVGRALLSEFVPMGINSPLPARLEPDGRLRLQVRPGHWQIELTARHPREITSLAMTPSPKPWPESEVWTFDARSHLRLVEVEGVAPVDPRQTNLPSDWKNLPAYRMWAGDILSLNIIRRGDPQPEPNALSLRRILWLDFDGRGYTVNDVITGSMTQGWRLETNPEMRLGRVALDSRIQLITKQEGEEKVGVEVRRGAINLSADSRIDGQLSSMTAVGWDQDFQRVSTLINLPPGWRLFSAMGVDNAPNTWLYRWTLLDLFLVMIASLAVFRLWNGWWGLCALLTFVLVWQEPGAPRFVWLNILAAIALLRVLPEGRFRVFAKLYRNVFLLGLVLIVLPFMVSQVRNALYPQLEHPWQPIIPYRTAASAGAVAPSSMEMQVRQKRSPMPEAAAPREDSVRSFAGGSANDKAQDFDDIDPSAIVQTGPGLPRWKWNQVELSWNGPVDKSQRIHLIYFSPSVVMVTNFLRVFLILALSLLLLGVRRGAWPLATGTTGALPVWLLAGILAVGADDAAAEIPDRAMLEELKSRLLAPPECLPACAQIGLMHMKI
ncbi:MAG: hypothetical protein ABFS02_05695, partial [Pseudomonadota bacterium]